MKETLIRLRKGEPQDAFTFSAQHPLEYYEKHATATVTHWPRVISLEIAQKWQRYAKFADAHGIKKTKYSIYGRWFRLPGFDHCSTWFVPGQHRAWFHLTEPYHSVHQREVDEWTQYAKHNQLSFYIYAQSGRSLHCPGATCMVWWFRSGRSRGPMLEHHQGEQPTCGFEGPYE